MSFWSLTHLHGISPSLDIFICQEIPISLLSFGVTQHKWSTFSVPDVSLVVSAAEKCDGVQSGIFIGNVGDCESFCSSCSDN